MVFGLWFSLKVHGLQIGKSKYIPLMLNLLNVLIMTFAVLCVHCVVACRAVGLCFPENIVFSPQLVIILHVSSFDSRNIRFGRAIYNKRVEISCLLVSTAILGLYRVCF